MDDLTKAALTAGAIYLGYPGADAGAAASTASTGSSASSLSSYASAGAGLAGGILTNIANADRADAANAWSAQQYAKRYQVMTADMKAAGLNPMLAYTQNAGSAPTAQQVTFQNPMSAATQGYQQMAQGDQSIASASQAQAQVNLVEANVDKVKEEIKNIPLEGRRLERLSALLAEQLNVAFQETQSKIQSIKVMQATINKIGAETSLLDNQVEVERSLSTLGRTSKELAPAASILLDIIRASRSGK